MIEEANRRAQVLQPEVHFDERHEIWHKVVPYLHRDHPFYSTLNLHWTGSGYWMDFPREPSQIVKQDEDLEKYHIARVEPYITPEGEKSGPLHMALDHQN